MSTQTAWLDRWVIAVNNDLECLQIGRFSHFVVEAESTDGQRVRMRYSAGAATIVGDSDSDAHADVIHLRGSDSTWLELADADALPLRHDLLSLIKADNGIEVVSGWIELVRHLRVISRLVEIGKSHVER